ncbi:MAG: hypothetical protein WCJ74_00140, partial [bacterium]
NALPIYNIYFELMSSRSVIPAKAGIHKYFSGEKSSGHDSARQPPSLQSGPIPTSQSENADLDPREYPRITHGEGELGVKIFEEKRDVFMAIARIFSLLRRLVPEEGCEALIFDDMEQVCKNAQTLEYSKKSVQTLEWLFILRMMCFLGYSHKENFGNLCEDEIEWTNEYLDSISSYKDSAIHSINKALEASHL